MKEQELIQKLQNMIAVYDKVFFLPDGAPEIVDLLNSCPKEQYQKKMLLLSGNMLCRFPEGMDLMQVDEEACIALKRLYHTYEFSDRFRMLSMDGNFGSIINYVRTGVLSAREIAAALLG